MKGICQVISVNHIKTFIEYSVVALKENDIAEQFNTADYGAAEEMMFDFQMSNAVTNEENKTIVRLSKSETSFVDGDKIYAAVIDIHEADNTKTTIIAIPALNSVIGSEAF